MKVNIRKYRSKDKVPLVKLWETVFPDDPAHNEPSKVIDAKLAVDDLIFLAELDDQLIGACMAGYDGHRGWLYAVAVLPEYRKSGAGRRLVESAMKALSEVGCIKVNLQIRSTNTEVAAFYQSLGFEVEDRMSMGRFIRSD
ncbi:MAG: GNAT family acetyltransferase [Gammaproteobacteria bacterium]|nr:GNAT family acetyltransferase [Gammaproteobacteria bacterium]